jgi:IMS family HHH motif
MLLARLATKEAKPNGQHALGLLSGPVQPKSDSDPSEEPQPHHQAAEEVKQFLEQLPLSQLPGVGYKLEKKLNEKNLFTCGDILNVRKESLKVRLSSFSLSTITLVPHFWFLPSRTSCFHFLLCHCYSQIFTSCPLHFSFVHPHPSHISHPVWFIKSPSPSPPIIAPYYDSLLRSGLA